MYHTVFSPMLPIKSFYLYLTLTLLTLFTIMTDAITYPGFLKKHVLLDTNILFILFLVTSVYIFFLPGKIDFSTLQPIKKLNSFILLPVIAVFTFIFTFADFFLYPNFTFSTFHIHYSQFLYLLLISTGLALVTIDRQLLKRRKHALIFSGAFFLLFIGICIWLWPNGAFFELSKEDRLFENLQFLFFSLSTILAALITKHFFNKDLKHIAILFFFITMFLFFVSGEEIAWGQRIFHIESPAIMKENNTQHELTLHNLKAINQYQYLLYMLLGAYGAFSWIISSFFPYKKIRDFLHNISIPWFAAPYFLPIFLFYLYVNFIGGKRWEWQEFSELLLALGITIFLLVTYIAYKPTKLKLLTG